MEREPDKLLKSADLALYKAKSDGRNCYRFFEPTLDEGAATPVAFWNWICDMPLASNEFQVHYQPLIDARSRQVCAFEALLRWYRPDGSTIPPSDFIPVAEKMGLIHSLGRLGAHHGLPGSEEMAGRRLPRCQSIAGPVQQAMTWLMESAKPSMRPALAPQRLQLEITEGLLLEDVAETVSTLQQLRDMGVCIAVDDFRIRLFVDELFAQISVRQSEARSIPHDQLG